MTTEQKIWIQHYSSPVGDLLLGDFAGQLCLCDWRYRTMRGQVDVRLKRFVKAEFADGETPITRQAAEQLEEYFQQSRTAFDLPILLAGSEFQQQVWRLLQQVEYGQTVSYLDVAERLGNPKTVRAVAAANGANGVSIIVPCHRVIGKDGSLTGYAGGIETKKRLLKLEGASLPGQTLALL